MITANMATIKWEQRIPIFGESLYGVSVDYQHTNISEEALTRPMFKYQILLIYDELLISYGRFRET